MRLRPRRSRTREPCAWIRAGAFCLVLLAVNAGFPQARDPGDTSLVHWAYATTFGTGTYRIGDQDVLVFRAPFGWTWREAALSEEDGRRLGIKFLFPVTVGAQDFDLTETSPGEIPDRLEQWSFAPGAEIEIPINQRWALRAHGHIGWGSELGGGDESAWIYGAGIRSRYTFALNDSVSLKLLNGLLWTGYSPSRGARDALSRLMTGVELDFPAGRWQVRRQQVYLKPHLVNYWYLDGVEFFFTEGELPSTLGSEWELGLAVGGESAFKLWRFKLDRMGLAYRVGDDTRGIRFVFSSVF